MNRPIIGIPLGDIAGIGPEILVKALEKKEIYDVAKPIVIGEYRAVERVVEITGVDLKINVVQNPAEGKYELGHIDLIDMKNVDTDKVEFGKIQGEAGRAAFEYIEKCVELCKNGQVIGIATTPINKEALKAGDINYIGHTEILAGLTNSYDPLTMFQVYDLRVFFLTRHVSLGQAVEMIKEDRVLDYIRRSSIALENLGIDNPKMAVAGLNPHSGEHGLFGDEEVKEIEPAIRKAREEGIDIVGPIAADSVFHIALKGTFDGVLSLYHDQGHIATKMVDFEKTISVTIGLPFMRTSVDHGTAFDIAGKNIATSVSMEEAIKLAAVYSPRYIAK